MTPNKKSGGQFAAAVDEECGDADDQQPQSRRFGHGLKGQSIRGGNPGYIGGKSALRSARREFKNTVTTRRKQISRAVKSQPFWIVQTRGKGAPRSTRREFINVACVVIRLKQVPCAVNRQTIRNIQPGGKGALHSARCEFINVAT